MPANNKAVIDNDAKLAELLPSVQSAPWLGIDTEADSLHSYPEKLCLIQLSVPHQTVLIDPLSTVDLTPFWRAIDGKELILHGSDYDLRLLHRSAGFVPVKLFDTMLAARVLGIMEFGLNSLVRSLLGISLEKGSQKANWSRRPLTEKMVTYALADAHHLKPLADELRRRMVELGRISWHEQLCRQLVEDATQAPRDNSDEVWRIKAADRLSRRGLAVLKELWRWREQEAIATNRPPFFVLAHDTLFAMAVSASNGEPIQPLIPKRYSPRRQMALQEAVDRALGLPEHRLPDLRRHRGQRITNAQRDRAEELRRRRDASAHRLSIDPSMIASRATLNDLARDWDTTAADLLPWQRELLAG